MTVYVDMLFVLNAAINYLFLRGSAALGGCSVRLWRLLTAAAVGGGYAVLTVLPNMMFLCAMPMQGLFAVLMLVIAFGFRKNTVKQGLFFFAFSFAFGGAVLLLVQKIEPDCLLLGGSAYYAVSMPAMLLLAGVCYGIAAFVLKNCGRHTGGDILPVTLYLEGKCLQLKALRDTGNTLQDPIGGQTALIADGEKLLKFFPQSGLDARALKDPAALVAELSYLYPQCRFCLLPYRAVGVESGLLAAVRCRGTVGKKEQPVLAAFSPGKLSCDETFDALWGGAVT